MAKPLHILVAHNVSRAPTGGMSRIMGFIHDHISSAGHTVDYLCAEDVPAALGGTLSRFTFPLLVLHRAAVAARAGRPYDLVNVHEPQSAAIAAFKGFAGNPVVVVTSHGVERRAWELALEELRLGRTGPTFKSRLVYPVTSLWQSGVGLRRANHVFCLNEEDRSYLTRWLNRPASDITRIFPAADVAYSEAVEGRDYGRATRLLFSATWRKNKGIEDLVPAFVKLASRWPDLTLTVLGAGLPESAVRAAFPEQVRGRVHMVQTHSEAENVATYAASDLFLLPSLFEGTPLSLLEGMMSGLPIVTTAVCGMKDVIRDGENGLLVPIRSPDALAAAVERLLADGELRARLGRAAREEVLRTYTWDRVAGPVRQVYERLCNARGRARREQPRPPIAPPPPPREPPSPAAPRSLRVLLASFVDDNEWTGMGKWAHQTSRSLTRLGHAPTLWFADDFLWVRPLGRLAVLVYPVALAARLLRVRDRFDGFVVHEPGSLWYAVLRKLFPSLPPMVVMCHNVESSSFLTLRKAAWSGLARVPMRMQFKSRLFRHWQSDGALVLADHVVSLSTHDRNYLERQLGLPAHRITTLVNGVSAEHFCARAGPPSGQRVLFVGGWLDVKGRRVLPGLWSQVRNRFPAATLTVAGAGRPAALVLAEFDPAARTSVRVNPLLTREKDMRGLFAAHDLFLMPSLSEGSPLALLEAMATAMPVVASRVGGIPDVVTHGVNGLLFDPLSPADGAEAVCALLSNPEEAERLGCAGQQSARALTWDAAARGLLSAIERAVGVEPQGRPTGRRGAPAPQEDRRCRT